MKPKCSIQNIQKDNIILQELKILSYNIHGLENKIAYVDFFDYIKTFDIFALLETHIIEEKTNRLTKFLGGFDLIWRPAEKVNRFGRAIGGCCIGVKSNLKNNNFRYSFQRKNEIDIVELKIENQTVTIVPLYIRANDWITTFYKLEKLFTEDDIKNPIIIGDLNVRIGNYQQVLDENIVADFKSISFPKKSRDVVANAKGRDFIKLCNDYGLYILNGATVGDEEGNFTFISTVGESVNDICAIGHDLLKSVNNFHVDIQDWSDHLPIIVSFQFQSSSYKKQSSHLLPKLVWKDKDTESYKSMLNQNLNVYKESSRPQSLESLSQIIKSSVSNICLPKSFTSKSKWFDGGCANARKKSFKWLRKYRKTGNLDHRENYLLAYRDLKNKEFKAKVSYAKQLEDKINTVQTSKDWWKIAKEIRGETAKECTSISASTFQIYFKVLFNPLQISADIQYAAKNCMNEDLDMPITLEEVKFVLNKAKIKRIIFLI